MATDDDFGSAPTAYSWPNVPTPAPGQELPSVIAGRYEVLGLLGAGGMGRVYRVHDKSLDEIVALKIMRGDLASSLFERFRQEVKLARRVTHPNVVRTFDLGQHGDDHFLTMEYIDGRSLSQLLDDGPLAVDEVLRVARAAAAGIAAAHGGGVLHRDLKPDNILVGKDGRIAITDFGVATPAASPIATAERVVGTPAYMAPEQVEPGAPIGPATDVYAFGAILYEMLTGARPFGGSDIIQVAIARLRQPPPDPRTVKHGVPGALADLVLRCMAREPRDRFADGSALAAALADPSLATTHDTPTRLPATVPASTSRSVAILPLRASEELHDIADGIAEEIADALSMSRSLRVRPLASVRKLVAATGDAREVGKTLGVDVLVDGSVRRRGEQVRISARVIGVADDLQLWANHFDARPDALLETSDAVVRAVAQALTVDLAVPTRGALDARAAELYLAGKARLRAAWVGASLQPVIDDLQRAHELAPDDPAIAAVLATGMARSAFLRGGEGQLARARELADRAVSAAPALGETWFARGVASRYSGDSAQAAVALVNACSRTPGFAMAQAILGAILLEVGLLEGAIRHLEAAESLDPLGIAHLDLPRAYVYAGRWDDAMHQLDLAKRRPSPNAAGFDEISRARFHMWRGEKAVLEHPENDLPPSLREFVAISARVHATAQFLPEDRARMAELVTSDTPRLRATLAQFLAEFLLFAGDPDEAMRWIELSFASGLEDHMWMQHCPMLAPLRGRADFQALAARVAERASAVVAATMLELGKLS